MTPSTHPRAFAPVLLPALLAALSLMPTHAEAQDAQARRLRPAVGAHVGYASIENAKGSLEIGAFADVGSYRRERVRMILGVDYLSTTSTRPAADGSFSDLTLSGDLRWKPFSVGTVAPFVGAGIGVHLRSNDASDPTIRDLYNGLAVGYNLSLGSMIDFLPDGTKGAVLDLRRVQAQNVDRTSFRVGAFYRF
jgi:hypothetical protein